MSHVSRISHVVRANNPYMAAQKVAEGPQWRASVDSEPTGGQYRVTVERIGTEPDADISDAVMEEMVVAYYKRDPITMCDAITDDGDEINRRTIQWESLTPIQQTTFRQRFHRDCGFIVPIIDRLLINRQSVPEDAVEAASYIDEIEHHLLDPNRNEQLQVWLANSYNAGYRKACDDKAPGNLCPEQKGLREI